MSKQDLTVYPLKDTEKRKNVKDMYPLVSPSFFLGILGKVAAGKTTLLNNLILRFYKDVFDVVILISSTAKNDPVNASLIEHCDFVFTEYSEEILKTMIEMIESDRSDSRYLIVLDDVIGDVKQKKSGDVDYITALSTKYRHIGNEEYEGKVSFIIVSQYFKYLSVILRQNLSGLYLCGRFPAQEIKKIAEAFSYFGGSDKAFLDIYKRSRQGKYDFCFLNVQALEARRNHNEILWKDDENEFPLVGGEDEKEEVEKN